MLLSVLKRKELISLATCVFKPEILISVPTAVNRRLFPVTIYSPRRKEYHSKGIEEISIPESHKHSNDLKDFVSFDLDEIKSRKDVEDEKRNTISEDELKGNVPLAEEYFDGNHESEEVFKSENDPKDFGKIVKLDLEDVKILSENVVRKQKKQKYLKNTTSTFTEDDIKYTEDEYEEDNSERKKLKYRKEMKTAYSFRSVMTNLKSRRQRFKRQEIVIEGKRLIHDAILSGVELKQLFFSRVSDIESLNVPQNVKLIKVKYKDLSLWSDLVTSQGVVGVFKMPDRNHVAKSNETIPLIIICDNVRDPGNMGCILRIAAAVGCEKLLLTKGCADIWESKVLRGGSGAHFRLNSVKNLHWNEIESEVPEGSKVVLAGIKYPIAEDGEPEEKSCFRNTEADNENLPLLSYTAVDYAQQKTVIVIGGETIGLSPEAAEFAAKRQGVKVYIPMTNNVESLNNAAALGIISYEVRRQLECSNRLHNNETQQEVEACTE